MGKRRRNKQKALPAVTSTVTTSTKLFVNNNLLVHSVQERIWGESKSGKGRVLHDYALNLQPGGRLFLTKEFGESVIGKIYELDAEQLSATDKYMGEEFTREIVNTDKGIYHLYLLKG